MTAHLENKITWSANAEAAFITKGFANWKDATMKFEKHQTSKCHEEAVLKIVNIPATTQDIAESLSAQQRREKLNRRQCFLKLLSNIRFLARQGLPLRGHGDETDSNFYQLFRLRGEDDPRIETWLKKKTDKYTSADIQNEVLGIMALQVLRNVTASIRAAPFFAIMVDETADISNKEQLVICFRWVDQSLEAHEDFIGLYEIESTAAAVLLSTIQDVFTRVNISITKARGQCYDGASSMAGSRAGVATKILQAEPRAVYTHCYGHALNLACSDTVKQCKVMRSALDIVYEITKLIKKLPRRQADLDRLKQQLATDSPGIRILCPTRWTVRADALQSILLNYEVLQLLWEDSLEVVKEAEMRSRIVGVSTCMKTFDFFFGVVLGEMLLRHSDNLSRTLQSTHLSAAEGQTVAAMTVQTLQSLRSEQNFRHFWSTTVQKAKDLCIHDPVLPRKRRAPRRYEVGSGEGSFEEDVQVHYRRIFYEALDLIISCIKNRFEQPGYQVYRKLEDLVVKAAKKEVYDEELEFVCNFYGQDFNREQLKMQLAIMANSLPQDDSSGHDFHFILNYLRGLSGPQKTLMSEVCTLVSMILVMPASNAVSERSFSALRRVKTYLRSTMTQTRLNSIMTLHVHKEITDQLSLVEIGDEFVRGSEHRQTLFGKFLPTD